MQIRDLEWLLTAADLEHVTDAAAALGTSQPNLSRAIARVEDELGARIFTRAPDGVHVTPLGASALAEAQVIVERYAAMVAIVRTELDPDAGVARLAFVDSMATRLVPRLLGEFHAAAPRVRVELRQQSAREVELDVINRAVDLGVTTGRVEGLGWHLLQRERLVVAVPRTHRLSTRKRVTLDDLRNEELVTVPSGFGYRTLIDELLRAAGVVMDISFESADLATIEGLVAAGLGIALVPEQMVGLSGTVGIRLVGAPAASREIGLVWPTDGSLSPAAERLRSSIVASTASGDGGKVAE